MMKRLRSLNYRLFCRLFHASRHKVTIPNVSVADYVFDGFSHNERKEALVDGITDKRTSFDQLRSQIEHVTNNLASLNLSRGQVACLCGLNAPEFAHVFCSVTSLGAALTIANSQLTQGELLSQVMETKSTLLFVTEDCAEKAKQVKQHSNNVVKNIIVLGRHEGCIPFENMLRPSSTTAVHLPTIEPTTDVALIPYSSGTTGLPKGVQLTHRNLVAELAALRHEQFLPFYDGDSSLSALPMVHIAGLVIGMLNPLSQGATVVTLPRFQPETFLTALQRYKTTFSLIAPPVVNFLAHDPMVERYDLSHWRTPYSGAAPLSKDLTEKMVERLSLQGVRQGYGMSEASPATHTTPLDGWQYGSIGIPLPNTESKIVDVDSQETLQVGEQGEIWVRGPQIMKGYLNNPQATADTITHDGWLKTDTVEYIPTGDIGYYDNQGHYYVVDRLKEIIKYKGYQIAPVYLESLLLEHNAVTDAAVVGTPHEVHGQLPTAYVVCNKQSSAQGIADYVNAKVAPYKQLRGGVHIVKELPRSPSGKLLRRQLE